MVIESIKPEIEEPPSETKVSQPTLPSPIGPANISRSDDMNKVNRLKLLSASNTVRNY